MPFQRLCRICGIQKPIRSEGFESETGWRRHLAHHRRRKPGRLEVLVRCADCGVCFRGTETFLGVHSLICTSLDTENAIFERFTLYREKAEELRDECGGESETTVTAANAQHITLTTSSEYPGEGMVSLPSHAMMHLVLKWSTDGSEAELLVQTVDSAAQTAGSSSIGRHRWRRSNCFPSGFGVDSLDRAVDEAVPPDQQGPREKRPWASLGDIRPLKRQRQEDDSGYDSAAATDSPYEGFDDAEGEVSDPPNPPAVTALVAAMQDESDANDDEEDEDDDDVAEVAPEASMEFETSHVLSHQPPLRCLNAADAFNEGQRCQKEIVAPVCIEESASAGAGRPTAAVSEAERRIAEGSGNQSADVAYAQRRDGFRIGLEIAQRLIEQKRDAHSDSPAVQEALGELSAAFAAAQTPKRASQARAEEIATHLRVREHRSVRKAFAKERMGLGVRNSDRDIKVPEFYHVTVPIDVGGVRGTVSCPLVNPFVVAQRIARTCTLQRDRFRVSVTSSSNVSVEDSVPLDYRNFDTSEWYVNAAITALTEFFETAEGQAIVQEVAVEAGGGGARVPMEKVPVVFPLTIYSDASRVATSTFGHRSYHPIYLSSPLTASSQSPGSTFLVSILPTTDMLQYQDNHGEFSAKLDLSHADSVEWGRVKIGILQQLHRVILSFLRGQERAGILLRFREDDEEGGAVARGLLRLGIVSGDLEEVAHLVHFKGATRAKCNLCDRMGDDFASTNPSTRHRIAEMAAWYGQWEAAEPQTRRRHDPTPAHVRFLPPPSYSPYIDEEFERVMGSSGVLPFGFDSLHIFAGGVLSEMWVIIPTLLDIAAGGATTQLLAAFINAPKPPSTESGTTSDDNRWRPGTKQFLSRNVTDFFWLRKALLTAKETTLLVLEGLPVAIVATCAGKQPEIAGHFLRAIEAARRVSLWLWNYPRQRLTEESFTHIAEDVKQLMELWPSGLEAVKAILDSQGTASKIPDDVRTAMASVWRREKPKQHMLTHLVDSMRLFGLPKASDTGPFEHAHLHLLKSPFRSSGRVERPRLLVEIMMKAWTGVLGRTGDLSREPLAPLVAQRRRGSETSDPTHVHGQVAGKGVSAAAAAPALICDIREAVRCSSVRRPGPNHVIKWVLERARLRLDPDGAEWNPAETQVMFYSKYKQYTSWGSGRGSGGIHLQVPVFVALKTEEAEPPLPPEGGHRHPFWTLHQDAHLPYKVWMGEVKGFVEVRRGDARHAFAVIRYAVPPTGSDAETAPPHELLGPFGVRRVILSGVKSNIHLELVSSILASLQVVPESDIVPRGAARNPRQAQRQLQRNKKLLVFHFDRLVHRVSHFESRM